MTSWSGPTKPRSRALASAVVLTLFVGSVIALAWATCQAFGHCGAYTESLREPDSQTVMSEAERRFAVEPHPPRKIHISVTLAMISGDRITATTDELIETRTTDPLVANVRAGREADMRSETAVLSAITPSVSYEFPSSDGTGILHITNGSPGPKLTTAGKDARISLYSRQTIFGADSDPAEGQSTGDIGLGVIAISPAGLQYSDIFAKTYEGLEISVSLHGFSVAGIRGGSPAEQSPTSLEYRDHIPMTGLRIAAISNEDRERSTTDALDGWYQWYSDHKSNRSLFVGSGALIIALLIPVAVYPTTLWREQSKFARTVRRAAITTLAITCLTGLSLAFETSVFQSVGNLGILAVAPLATLFALRRANGTSPVMPLDFLWCVLLPATAVGVDQPGATWMIVVTLAAMGLALVLVLPATMMVKIAAVSTVWITCALLIPHLGITGMVNPVMGLMLAPVAAAAFISVMPGRSWAAWSPAFVLSAVFFNSPIILDTIWRYPHGYRHPTEIIQAATEMALPVLAIFAGAAILRKLGSTGRSNADPVAWAAGISLITAVSVTFSPAFVDLLPAILTGTLAAAWLTPHSRAELAGELAGITASDHKKNVRHELRRRLFRDAERELLGSVQSKFVDGTLAVSEFEERQDTLNSAADASAALAGDGISSDDIAFSSAAGNRPMDNALVSAWAGLALAAPIVIWELVRASLNVSGDYLFGTIDTLRHAGRWAGYAAFFGFFYSRVRGNTPITKALALLVAVLPGEIVWIFGAEASGRDRFLAIAAVTGQAAIFSLGLGLFWEYRIVSAAGFSWTVLRSVRRIRSLGIPATTILVAAATAAATALGGAAVQPLVTPAPPSPSSTAPATTSNPP